MRRKVPFVFKARARAVTVGFTRMLGELCEHGRNQFISPENVQKYYHGAAWIAHYASNPQDATTMMEISHEQEIPLQRIVNGDFSILEEHLNTLAEKFHASFVRGLYKTVGDGAERISAEQDAQIEALSQHLIQTFAEKLLDDLKKSAPSMLKEHKKLRKGFADRNYLRWKEGFDKLYMLIVISEEMGQAIDNAIRPDAAENYKFDAISHLYARAFLLAREILCLMRNGFPDGALGRWRTLHEIAVVATFLQKYGQSISSGYLLSRDVQTYKAARQYREHEKSANLTPFGEEEFRQVEKVRNDIIAQYPYLDGEWGWAAPAIGKQRVTFFDIEKDVELDHWRPRYKWASQDTHGNHRPTAVMLALCEKNYEELAFPAESNSGMADPAHMMALSLILVANAYVQIEPNIDRLISLRVMQNLGDEIGETFLRLEKETMAAHLSKKRGLFRT